MLTPLKTKNLPLHEYINILWLELVELTSGTILLTELPLLVDPTFFPERIKLKLPLSMNFRKAECDVNVRNLFQRQFFLNYTFLNLP